MKDSFMRADRDYLKNRWIVRMNFWAEYPETQQATDELVSRSLKHNATGRS